MLNQCQFIGHLGADPEVRAFSNGGKVCNFRIACTEKWKDKQGEKKERTEWVSVAIFNEGLAGVAERYLNKGSKVYISGKMQTRKWQDQSGADRYSTEVVLQGFDAKLVMLDGPRSSGGNSDDADRYAGGNEGASSNPPSRDIDDEIPF